LITRFNKG